MTDEVAELTRLGGWAAAAMMAQAPGFTAAITRDSALVLSGEPVADLNMLFVGAPAADADLVAAMETVNRRGLPLLALFAPAVAETLAPLARRFGLHPAGAAPLMVLRGGVPGRLVRDCEVRGADEPSTIRAAGDLVSQSFDLPRDSVARSLDASLTATVGARAFVAFSGGMATSVVTVTRAGSTAGLWCMATPPDSQRKGVGRALLTRVIGDHRRAGVERFYLIATDAGRPLYESIGFRAIADYSVWTLGQSTQVRGSAG